MGLYGAMTTAVAGLTAQSFALENISGNIANSQTTGFKRVDTSFSDMVMSFGSSPSRQTSGSVLASARPTNDLQGAIESSNIDTFIAISGDGYFQVQQKSGEADGQEIFTGTDVYTRRGDFKLDKQNYLINGAGYYLKAIPIDPTTGNPKGDVAQVFQLTSGNLPANPTKSIDYQANLPASPKIGKLDQAAYTSNPAIVGTPGSAATGPSVTAGGPYVPITAPQTPAAYSFKVNNIAITIPDSADGDASGSIDINEVVASINSQLTAVPSNIQATQDGTTISFANTVDLGALSVIEISAATGTQLGFGTGSTKVSGTNAITAGTGIVTGQESAIFTQQSMTGSSVTLYDQQGAPIDVQFRWALVGSTPSQSTWNLFYETNATATGAAPRWQNVGQNFAFNGQGNLIAPAGGKITIPNMSVNSKALGNIDFKFGAAGLTQYSSTQSAVSITMLSQDGYTSGSMTSIGVGSNGRVSATYSNGQQIDVAEVPLYRFNADQQLKRLTGGAFAATRDSGTPLKMADTKMSGGALEASNTDIAEEFSKMIVTQQAYSANSKIISTTNTMMQDILNIVR